MKLPKFNSNLTFQHTSGIGLDLFSDAIFGKSLDFKNAPTKIKIYTKLSSKKHLPAFIDLVGVLARSYQNIIVLAFLLTGQHDLVVSFLIASGFDSVAVIGLKK